MNMKKPYLPYYPTLKSFLNVITRRYQAFLDTLAGIALLFIEIPENDRDREA
jgi:hypothetical protein